MVRAISDESIYCCMLLFLDRILYRRAHFVHDELRALRAVLTFKNKAANTYIHLDVNHSTKCGDESWKKNRGTWPPIGADVIH